jgi:hypothetical protein
VELAGGGADGCVGGGHRTADQGGQFVEVGSDREDGVLRLQQRCEPPGLGDADRLHDHPRAGRGGRREHPGGGRPRQVTVQYDDGRVADQVPAAGEVGDLDGVGGGEVGDRGE